RDRRAGHGDSRAAAVRVRRLLQPVAAGMAIADVAAQAQPGLLLAATGEVGRETQAGRGQADVRVATTALQRGDAALLAEAVHVELDVRVLHVGLQLPAAEVEAVAQVGEGLAGIGVVAAAELLREARECGGPLGFHAVTALRVAQGQAQATPGAAGVHAEVAAAGLATRGTRTHVEVGVAAAAVGADAPAGADLAVHAHQHRVAAVLGARGVA